MHRISQWLCFGTLFAAACAMPAKAQVLLYELRGTVDSISDSAGVLGTVATGSSFDLIYRGDFSTGWRSGAVGGGGGNNFLTGGSYWADPIPGAPNVASSPISAVLTINGHALDFPGKYFGQVEYTYALDIFNPADTGRSWANLDAQDGLRTDGSFTSKVSSEVDAFSQLDAFGSVDRSPLSLTVDGTLITGTTTFSFVSGAGTPQESVISGTLTPLSYTASLAAVPEPAEWLLLALGLAALPALGRRRR